MGRARACVLDVDRVQDQLPESGPTFGFGNLGEDPLHVDAAMRRPVPLEAPRGLLELPPAAGLVPATGVEPRDRDVDEPLEEVTLGGGRGAPLVLELLVRLEVGARADELQALL